jgi:spectinomycin phosphotransferase/16S rRNA (guanine(1405)-N(7))-methyltransferase
VLTPPDGLPEELLMAVLDRGWGLTVTGLAYRPVGWGSHHWEVTDASGGRWFVTADELENKRHTRTESLTEAFARLQASLATAVALRDAGLDFVVAPVVARDGVPLARAEERFGVALYPWVDGQSFDWGSFPGPGHRQAVLDMLVAIHAAPPSVARHALADDLAIPHRDQLDAALAEAATAESSASATGPYAGPLASLMAGHAGPLGAALDIYDQQRSRELANPAPLVVTHGEPHPGNTMLAAGRWLLIDWDTVLLAPPERDLWSLDPGDGSVLAAYAAATGVTPRAGLLDLYRRRWDLADVAIDVSRFRRPHQGSPEDDEAFALLRSVVEGLSSPGPG